MVDIYLPTHTTTGQDSGCCSLLQVLAKVTNGVPLAGSLIVAVTKCT